MFEVVACICGVLLVGGIAKICSGERYTEEYYRYVRNNKKAPGNFPYLYQDNYYRFL